MRSGKKRATAAELDVERALKASKKEKLAPWYKALFGTNAREAAAPV